MSGRGAVQAEAPPSTSRWSVVQPWVSLVLRLGLAVVAFWAGAAKLSDLPASVRAVRAYELLPSWLEQPVGYALPMIEVLLGLLLAVGLLTRASAFVFGLLMLAFVVGIASAWARGLAIDCGCFGGGGAVDVADTRYLVEILRDVGLVLVAAFLVVWPRSRFSLDRALGIEPAPR